MQHIFKVLLKETKNSFNTKDNKYRHRYISYAGYPTLPQENKQSLYLQIMHCIKCWTTKITCYIIEILTNDEMIYQEHTRNH